MAAAATGYYLDIQLHRSNPYGLIRRSYRENGKVKKETLCRLPDMPLETLYAIRDALRGKTISVDDFVVANSREYGASYAVLSMLKQLGLHTDIFYRSTEEWVKGSIAMIVGRLVNPCSKLALSHSSSYTALWELCGINEIDVNKDCYDAMDRLYSRQDAIQQKLAARHLSNGTLVLYDITSCYMEGAYEQSDLVAFGYNRDRKRGHEQIVISLLCTKDGCPIAVEVLKGNTSDGTTVLDKIAELRDKYHLDKVVFVGDRGMITQANNEKINHEWVKVISALTHGKLRAMCEEEVIQLSMFDEKNIVEVIDDGIRYCLCKNPLMAEREAATRRDLLKKTTELLDEIIGSTRKTKYSKAMRAGRIIGKYKMGKYITFSGTDDDLRYTLNTEKIDEDAALDGCYVIFSDVPADEMTAAEVVQTYKRLTQVEQAFRNMKTTHLELRPVYHKTDDRIRAHVFVCMLAYYVMWHMQQRLKQLFETDGVGKDRKYTFRYVIEILKCITIQDIEVEGVATTMISKPTEEQQHILDLLGVKIAC